MPANILLVDDDAHLCTALTHMLASRGDSVRTASSGVDGIGRFDEDRPDLVLLDLGLPDMGGLEVLRALKERAPDCPVIIITAYDSARHALDAVRAGADDYATKPLDMNDLMGLVAKHADHAPRASGGLPGVIGECQAMKNVFDLVARIGPSDATVLVTGESGTGKEAIARALHDRSRRAESAFVALNCASIPQALLEAELFGHEKGAFTDAKARKKGLLEIADGGSLFLDEIALLPLDLQGKILTVLESRRFRRVGGTQELSTDVRFLAATNADLLEASGNGSFREDLYYRLNVIPVHLPPLRDRGEDVVLLASVFLDRLCRLHATGPKSLTPEAEELLNAYPWPGNVRELKNVLERAVLLTDGSAIDVGDLSIDRRSSGRGTGGSAVRISNVGLIEVSFPAWGIPLEDLERRLIEEALTCSGQNISKAAKLLHVSRHVLRYRMQKHGISPPSKGNRATPRAPADSSLPAAAEGHAMARSPAGTTAAHFAG